MCFNPGSCNTMCPSLVNICLAENNFKREMLFWEELMIDNSVAFTKLETEVYLIYNLRPAYITKKRICRYILKRKDRICWLPNFILDKHQIGRKKQLFCPLKVISISSFVRCFLLTYRTLFLELHEFLCQL